MLTVVEKVLFLQDVEIFNDTPTEDLAHIAAITEEVTIAESTVIYREGDISDSMYLVVEGKVKLEQGKRTVMVARTTDVFGKWALFDDEPRVVTATTLESCRLLRIDREDFYDLLADHTRITRALLKNLSKRLRSLIENVKLELDQTQ